MIKLRSIIEIIQLVWKSKKKRYLVLTSTTNMQTAKVIEFNDFKEASKHGIELIRNGEVTKVRIVLEITMFELKSEIKK